MSICSVNFKALPVPLDLFASRNRRRQDELRPAYLPLLPPPSLKVGADEEQIESAKLSAVSCLVLSSLA